MKVENIEEMDAELKRDIREFATKRIPFAEDFTNDLAEFLREKGWELNGVLRYRKKGWELNGVLRYRIEGEK